jgi:hypothetical protein
MMWLRNTGGTDLLDSFLTFCFSSCVIWEGREEQYDYTRYILYSHQEWIFTTLEYSFIAEREFMKDKMGSADRNIITPIRQGHA